MRPNGLACIAAALMLFPASAAGAEDRLVRASNGAVVLIEPPESLDCPGLRAALEAIDATGYRAPGARPVAAPDRVIYAHEAALARRRFYACAVAGTWLVDPATVFSLGFTAE